MIAGRENAPAYLTMYLAMMLGVMTTLCLALIEGVRVNTLQLEAACIADTCTDNVLAEYHQELFRRFNLLAVDFSYGSGTASKENLEGRLAWYLDMNLGGAPKGSWGNLGSYRYRDFLGMQLEQANVTTYRLLSDDAGTVFRKKAVEAIRDDLGLAAIQDAVNWMKTVEDYQLDTRDVEAEKAAVDEKIASYQGKEIKKGKETAILKFDNPTVSLDHHKKMGIVWQTTRNHPVSQKKIYPRDLFSQRQKAGKVNQGNLPVKLGNAVQEESEWIFFVEYLRNYFGYYDGAKKGSALEYELEYMLAGKDSDYKNLEAVLLKLLAVREAANVAYLYSDQTKYKEADLVALALSALLGVPELQELFTTTILLGWAYAESVYDLSVLLYNRGRVPLMKDDHTWHYALSNILEDMWDGFAGKTEQEGLTYQEYLKVLLLVADHEAVTCRAMDMVEADIRLTTGNKNFRIDACCTDLKALISFTSPRGYRATLNEEKGY